MGFLKTSFWASVSTGVTLLSGLVTTKYVAVIIGPEGMAYVGQFANITTVLSLFATAACAVGIIKYLAEFKDFEKQQQIIANAFQLVGGCILLTCILTLLFSGLLAKTAFKNESLRSIFVIYGLLLIFPTFNALANAILNGLQQIKLLATLNIITAFANILFLVVGAKLFGLKGVLLAGTFSACVSFGFYYINLAKQNLLPPYQKLTCYNPTNTKLLLGFSAMTIVSGVLAPSLQLFVRSKLLHDFDLRTAGIWQANARLSDFYLNFFYTVIGIYYLPKLSEIQSEKLFRREIGLGYLRILPVVIAVTCLIWVFRDVIVQLFLTKNFVDMLILLKWQLIGDVIKISSWLLGYILWAKALKKTFIVTEILFSITYVLLSYLLINRFGIIGSVYAFTLNYTLYLFSLMFLLRSYIFESQKKGSL